LYIDDIYNSVPGEKIKLFADDTNLFIAAKSVSEPEVKANLLLSNINKWLGANRLHEIWIKHVARFFPQPSLTYIE